MQSIINMLGVDVLEILAACSNNVETIDTEGLREASPPLRSDRALP